MSGIEIPDKPKGIGSIIRVVFNDPGACDAEAFYVGAYPGRWVEYVSDGADEFTWKQMLQIVKFDEAEAFEVVYEGFRDTEKNDAFGNHIKDWIWREGL